LSAIASLAFVTRLALAGESSRRALPEALLTESTTDIDAERAGELEIEANLAQAAARVGGAAETFASLEVEWRILKEFGARLEPSYARIKDTGAISVHDTFGVSASVAGGIWHDLDHQLHLQGELLARTPDSANARVFEPGETELPLAADVLGAIRRGRWTLRATVGAEAGGSFAHAPMHTDLAVLMGLVPEERFGFIVLEARADWAREAPVVIAPEIVADSEPLGLPFRLGVALPVNVGVESTRTSYGVFVRLLWLAGGED
jgi:hypothetical protein